MMLIRSIVTARAAIGEAADQQDCADRPREHDRDPTEREVERSRGVEQDQHSEEGDHRPRPERDGICLHLAPQALDSAARWGVRSSCGPFPESLASAVSLLMIRSCPTSTLASIWRRGP